MVKMASCKHRTLNLRTQTKRLSLNRHAAPPPPPHHQPFVFIMTVFIKPMLPLLLIVQMPRPNTTIKSKCTNCAVAHVMFNTQHNIIIESAVADLSSMNRDGRHEPSVYQRSGEEWLMILWESVDGVRWST